jgi:alkyl hydroperoxide reductase subunit AhpC
VVAGPVTSCAADAKVMADPAGELAEAYGLRQPADRGEPVGYAIVDAAGRIRYRTLDPEVEDLLGEVDTILRAA